jgi:hypothetical protein
MQEAANPARAGLRIFLRQNELKDSTLRFVRLGPQSSVVSLDDRAADRQAHTQAARLGRVEGLKQPLELRWIQPRTHILHHNQHAARGGSGADQQLARPPR